MSGRYKPVDLAKLETYAIGRRPHKFDVERLAGLPPRGAGFREWYESLPPYLGVRALRAVADAVAAARGAGRPVVFAMGAHVIKVGCSPVVCDLIRRGLVTALAMNGATAIHDVEVATIGQTSEEVAETLADGRFGMVEETPAFFAEALGSAAAGETGLGAALGAHLERIGAPHADHSVLAAAHQAGIPATVHVAMGTDTIHMHENVAASDLLQRSTVDFRLICSVVADLAADPPTAAGGVWCNIGSAVLLPEVFLKAVAVARNMGRDLDKMTTANLDMIRHYRPSENVVGRPVKPGRGHHITGHHELLLPLLRQVLIERV
ncbi:MAG: hypothetical protein ACE5E1_06660 [Phycisphaerae bacterium]